jgi:hypothetical protein
MAMPKLKMGGQKTLRLFLKGNADLSRSLLEPCEGKPRFKAGLLKHLSERYETPFCVEAWHEPCGRSDLLLQELEGRTAPPELEALQLGVGASAFAQRTKLWDLASDVVVFSLQPEVAHPLWRHRQSGYLVYAPPRWQERATQEQQQRFSELFSPAGLLGVEQFKENFGRLINAVRERLDAHVVVFNCSSIDPENHIYNYHGREDDLSLRIHKFGLALIELSIQEGISVIDVDRQIAEMGCHRHVVSACHYSEEAYEAIGREFVRVLEDIGFFENRPLVMQIGQRRL